VSLKQPGTIAVSNASNVAADNSTRLTRSHFVMAGFDGAKSVATAEGNSLPLRAPQRVNTPETDTGSTKTENLWR